MGQVVVGVDSSAASARALRWAAEEARRAGDSLLVFHAILHPLTRSRTSSVAEELGDDAGSDAATLERLERLIEPAGADLEGLEVIRRVHAGRAAEGLLAAAGPARLLVVGSRGAGGFEGLLLGATAERCARHAVCPVVVVPALNRTPTGRISVGVDGSPAAARALAWAVGEAELRQATLEVVGVYHPYDEKGPFGGEFMRIADPGSTERFRREAERHVSAAIEAIGPQAGTTVVPTVLGGHPAKVLVDHAAASDLLVVGRRGGHGLPGAHLGSVTRQVLHHANCPVAVIPD